MSKGAGKTKQGEFLTSIKRYYSNSFTDRVKQDAMNLFLGYFQPSLHDYALWDLETDYFLHNRLLHPPRPDVDAILLASSSLFSPCGRVSEDSAGSVGRLSLTDCRPTLADLQEAEREYMESTQAAKAEVNYSPEVTAAMERYFYRSAVDDAIVRSRIAAIESIKKRLVDKKLLLQQAEEHWWRKALMTFENERLLMTQPCPKGGIQDLPYYEAFHQPHKLTSFDEEFSNEFQYPMDATIFAAPKTEASGYWNRRRESREAATESTRKDEDDDDEGNDGDTAQRDGAVASEFEFFSFARNLGTRARNIVGDLLKSNESDNYPLSNVPSRDATDKEKLPERPKISQDSFYSTGSGIFESPQTYQYSTYCNIGEHPEVFIDDNYGARPSEFDVAMNPYMVDEDDVKGMEKLARDCYIGQVISSGM